MHNSTHVAQPPNRLWTAPCFTCLQHIAQRDPAKHFFCGHQAFHPNIFSNLGGGIEVCKGIEIINFTFHVWPPLLYRQTQIFVNTEGLLPLQIPKISAYDLQKKTLNLLKVFLYSHKNQQIVGVLFDFQLILIKHCHCRILYSHCFLPFICFR